MVRWSHPIDPPRNRANFGLDPDRPPGASQPCQALPTPATVPSSGRPDGFDPREDLAWAARPRRGRNCRTRWDALSLLSRLMARRGRRESPYVGRGGMCRSSGKYRSAASSAIFFASDVLSVHHRLTARPKQQRITRFAHSQFFSGLSPYWGRMRRASRAGGGLHDFDDLPG